jgi:tRNA (guanine-N7-)-methyltransferase
MTKSKLERFAEVDTFKNVFQHLQNQEKVDEFAMKGKWNEQYFKNNNPIVLELGCGKGEYTIGMAEKNPNKNYIGADLKGNRIWVGAKTALDNNMQNVAFLRTRIENIAYAFAENEISEIWITFPDPQPQKTRERKRLTHPRFLDKYKLILKKEGVIQLKTDNEPLFQFTLEVIQERKCKILCYTNNLYKKGTILMNESVIPAETKTIKTYYEKLFSEKGFDICYVAFKND